MEHAIPVGGERWLRGELRLAEYVSRQASEQPIVGACQVKRAVGRLEDAHGGRVEAIVAEAAGRNISQQVVHGMKPQHGDGDIEQGDLYSLSPALSLALLFARR